MARSKPLLATQELCGEMRSTRKRYGFSDGDKAADALNEALRELFPDLFPERSPGDPPVARPDVRDPDRPFWLTADEVSNAEMANRWSDDAGPDSWLGVHASDENCGLSLKSSKLPLWLVRAYDLAFAADGYLVDMHAWVTASDAEHRSNPPGPGLPLVPPEGWTLEEWLTEGFEESGPEVLDLLRSYADVLASRSSDRHEPPWRLTAGDRNRFIDDPDDLPTGLPVPPGGVRILHWRIQNIGNVTWADRLVVPVGPRGNGRVWTPPCVPLPICAPKATAEILMPVRVPARAGTYRVVVKVAWPNGRYCFPTSIIGVALTIVVPRPEFCRAL